MSDEYYQSVDVDVDAETCASCDMAYPDYACAGCLMTAYCAEVRKINTNAFPWYEAVAPGGTIHQHACAVGGWLGDKKRAAKGAAKRLQDKRQVAKEAKAKAKR